MDPTPQEVAALAAQKKKKPQKMSLAEFSAKGTSGGKSASGGMNWADVTDDDVDSSRGSAKSSSAASNRSRISARSGSGIAS